MASASNRAAFTMLPDRKPRWDTFLAGAGLEIFLLSLLIIVPLLRPQRMDLAQHYLLTPVVAAPVVDWKPQPVKPAPVKQPAIPKEVLPKIAEVPDPPKPRIFSPVFSSPVITPSKRRNDLAPDTPKIQDTPYKDSTLGSSATPTLPKLRVPVQTGGFGDPDGLPGKSNPNKAANIAHVGSYDLPPGPGYGNGTGGAKGIRGVVPSAGFGNGVATPTEKPHGEIQRGSFATQTVAAPQARQAVDTGGVTQEVQILYKPRPTYTDEARAKKIEGDVLLQVVFTASGQVQVGSIVRGLGYGLNEAAAAAARQIRFKPAMRGGQPVDSSAIVHIVFELAY